MIWPFGQFISLRITQEIFSLKVTIRGQYHSQKIKSYLTRRQYKFLCLEQAIVAGRQSSSEDQKFAAKPNLSQIGPYFFGNGTIFTEKKWESNKFFAFRSR